MVDDQIRKAELEAEKRGMERAAKIADLHELEADKYDSKVMNSRAREAEAIAQSIRYAAKEIGK